MLSLSFLTLIRRLFSSSSLSAIRLVSSTYLRLLMFLPSILISACLVSQRYYLAISPSAAPSPFAFSLSQHKGLFKCQFYSSRSQSIRAFNISSSMVYFLMDWLVWPPCSPKDYQESSSATQFKGISSSVLSLLYHPTLTSIHDYWKSYSFDHMDLCQQSDVSAFLTHCLGLS